jgi:hypothetical protein
MSCMLLHPIHNLPVANAIVARNISVTPEIDALPRRKRGRAIVNLMFTHNLEAFRHRYAGNPDALEEAAKHEKLANAFSSARTHADPFAVLKLASSWSYQTSDHNDCDKLPTTRAVDALLVAMAKEGGFNPDDLHQQKGYNSQPADLWTAEPATIQPMIDAASALRAARRASRITKTPKASVVSDEALALLRSLVSDIQAMQSGVVLSLDDGDDVEAFGPFADTDENKDGVLIAWPNLSITVEKAQLFLEGQASLPLPTPKAKANTTTPAPTPAAQPTAMAAFVAKLLSAKAA